MAAYVASTSLYYTRLLLALPSTSTLLPHGEAVLQRSEFRKLHRVLVKHSCENPLFCNKNGFSRLCYYHIMTDETRLLHAVMSRQRYSTQGVATFSLQPCKFFYNYNWPPDKPEMKMTTHNIQQFAASSTCMQTGGQGSFQHQHSPASSSLYVSFMMRHKGERLGTAPARLDGVSRSCTRALCSLRLPEQPCLFPAAKNDDRCRSS